jgi:hypothetical protein
MPTLEDDRLVFRFPKSDENAAFRIGFQRTLRIPDSDKTYHLPPGLGHFPLRHAEDIDRLPPQIAARGGVVMPMWQAEALWLDFSHVGRRDLPVAVKVAAGKINAVTGEAWSPGLNRDPQDYVVAPTQHWLDGFASEPGLIRQFVAMPLGEGYTAEEQITGQAEWGGLQISVTPMKRDAWQRYRKVQERDLWALNEVSAVMMSCGMDMGLGAGGRMHQRLEEDPHDLADWDLRATERVFVSIIHAEHWLALTGQAPPTAPPSAEAYARAGLPWFALHGGDRPALPGAGALRRLLSVAERHAAQTGQTLPGSQDVQTGPPVRLGGTGRGKVRGVRG